METGMRYFFMRAQAARNVKGNEAVVRANMLEAVSIAEKIAPYRHHKLAAVKLNKDPVEPPFRKGASMDELRAEMQKHLEILAPVLDLEALLAPSDGIANREVQEERSSGTGSTLSAPVPSSVSASPSANAPRRHGDFDSSMQRSTQMIASLASLKNDYATAMRQDDNLEETAERL